MLKCPELLMKV